MQVRILPSIPEGDQAHKEINGTSILDNFLSEEALYICKD